MTVDLLGWLSDELSLVLLQDGDGGRVHVVSGPPEAAEAIAAGPMSLADAAVRLVGEALDPTEAQAIVERARAGERTRLDLGAAGLVLAWSEEPGRARLLHARSPAATLERRAAAAELAAGVTHEVANSLTAIAGWTRMAASSEPLPERTKQALQVVQRSAREALGAARGLLRTMRDTGSPSIDPSLPDHTPVAEVCHQVLDTLRPELEEASITLSAELPEDILAATSPAVLRLIVSNLVRNAFEALEGPGEITVGARPRGDRFVLTISDDGPGMSRETLANAFDRYFTTKETGTGLGLALVRDTVEEAGGQVEVQSRRGVGTRFEISLPVGGAAALSLRPPAVRTVSSGVHPKPFLLHRRILVVDDDAAMRSLVRTALELQGATVDQAQDRESALAHDGPWDVALVDLALGEDRGDALLAELTSLERVRHTVLMTGSADVELPAEGGPDALLRKPFELEELQSVLGTVLGDSAAEEAEA